ncbi:MAG: PilZ domain-containing protein [Nitrosomonadales bacterium]|nr:PilZ domain-containing protein [Nitrosomonadales bacterium]
MTQKDQRRAERIALLEQPKGEFFLHVKDDLYSVRSVLNISSQGISLQLDNIVGVATEVVLQYKYKAINIQVNGTVVWSRPSNGPIETEVALPYEIGINLISPHLLFSLMKAKYE